MKNSRRITLWLAVLVLILVGVLPLCVMLAASLADVRNYTGTLGNARIWTLFRNSLMLAALTTLAAGTAGVTLGILIAKTDLPLRTALTVVLSLPLLLKPDIPATSPAPVCASSATARGTFEAAHIQGPQVGR